MRRCQPKSLWLLLLGMAVVARVHSGDEERDRATLRGLKGVEVLIEPLAPKMEEDGLLAKQIQTDVELRLRSVGIRVLSREEALKAPGSSYLYVNVNALSLEEVQWVYSLRVELCQDVLLERDPSIGAFGVPTWSVRAVGRVGRLNLRHIRETVADCVDRFINAYLSVNPKPAAR